MSERLKKLLWVSVLAGSDFQMRFAANAVVDISRWAFKCILSLLLFHTTLPLLLFCTVVQWLLCTLPITDLFSSAYILFIAISLSLSLASDHPNKYLMLRMFNVLYTLKTQYITSFSLSL